MSHKDSPMDIALVGGRTWCREVLEKTSLGYIDSGVKARIIAVSDPDPHESGMVLADRMGLLTTTDYHDFYNPANHIDLIIILTPEKAVMEDILATKPKTMRVMVYHTFRLFWEAINVQERRLRSRNEEVETIINGIKEFILVLNPDKEIIDVNDTFLQKMGYSRETVVGKTCQEVFRFGNPPCLDDLKCPLNEVVRNKHYHLTTLERVNKDGEKRYFEVAVYPIWENDGRIARFIEISRDITERKKEEEEITRRLETMVEDRTRQLKETHAKLIHQDKMASLGKLSASVVHEINNPNAGILNLVMLMKRILSEGLNAEKDLRLFHEYLDLITSETRRISRIVSNLLAFSRQSKLEKKPLDLNRLIEKVLVLNANLFKINAVKVQTRLDEAIPVVVGSEDQLQQVFMNFISNAVESMETENGGELRIQTRFLSEKNDVLISFSDTGVGIPDENVPRLFEPFFTTKKRGKGVGLGLSVAYGIVQDHGGLINVTANSEKGTAFTVEIPVPAATEPSFPEKTKKHNPSSY